MVGFPRPARDKKPERLTNGNYALIDPATMSKIKTFTYEEAHTLLPVLQSLLKRCMDGKILVEQIEVEFQNLKHRIFLSGGLMVDVEQSARRRAERDKSLQEIKDTLAEIDSIGVQVKDLDMGLLDFPFKLDDEIVLLCWKYGEASIDYWHGMEEGFQGRKPVDERIRRPRKKSS
jgi:hypothetical protein